MPELPEIEIIKIGLEKKIVGLILKKIQVLNLKTFQGDPKAVEGLKVVGIWRRAKMLGVDFSGNRTLLFHLKMTGQLILTQNSNLKAQNYNAKLKTEDRLIGGHPTEDMVGQMPNKHTRVIFEFSNKSRLFFNDQRKFGWVRVRDKAKVKSDKLFRNLGPEPLDKSFTWQIFKQNLLRHKSLPVKVAIMNQEVVAGIGNIYASEALFNARIDPRRKVSTLNDNEFEILLKGIREALKVSVKNGGSTRTHFVDSGGKKGRFLDFAHVYNRENQPCANCSGKISKITQAGRGTFYCEFCQK